MNSDSPQPNSNGEVNEQITIEANAADSATVNPDSEKANPTSAQSNAGVSDTAEIKSLKAQLDERSSQYMRIAAD
ncbi:MAG: nucleotide exchange factor GrpE, partial [Rivularia sp. (in: cyanobacteria)]